MLGTLQARRVLDTIRGRSYEEAIMLMEYMPYRACEKIIKCLKSVRDWVTAVVVTLYGTIVASQPRHPNWAAVP